MKYIQTIYRRIYSKYAMIVISYFSFIHYANAAGTIIKPECEDANHVALPGCKTSTSALVIGTDLPKFISTLVVYVGIAAIITLMGAGLFYLTSLGNEEKTKKAAKMIYYSLLGLVIAVFSYTIIQIVVNLQFS